MVMRINLRHGHQPVTEIDFGMTFTMMKTHGLTVTFSNLVTIPIQIQRIVMATG